MCQLPIDPSYESNETTAASEARKTLAESPDDNLASGNPTQCLQRAPTVSGGKAGDKSSHDSSVSIDLDRDQVGEPARWVGWFVHQHEEDCNSVVSIAVVAVFSSRSSYERLKHPSISPLLPHQLVSDEMNGIPSSLFHDAKSLVQYCQTIRDGLKLQTVVHIPALPKLVACTDDLGSLS